MASFVLTEMLACEDLVQLISEIVHRSRMHNVLGDLLNRPGVFEMAMGTCIGHFEYDDEDGDFDSTDSNDSNDSTDSTDNTIRELVKGHEIRVRHDDQVYWWTTVVHIDDSHFVMMHEYTGSHFYMPPPDII